MKLKWILPGLSAFLLSTHTLASPNVSACERIQHLQMQIRVTESNIQNIHTTRTPEGGPYRPKRLICREGLCSMRESPPVKLTYEPHHPDANADGYVAYADIDLANEIKVVSILTRAVERAQRDCAN